MKPSECPSALQRDVLPHERNPGEIHGSCEGGTKCGGATSGVLEYFNPATSNSTDGQVGTSGEGPEGSCSTQPCRRQCVRVSGGSLGSFPPFFYVADGHCSNPVNLKRHRAASPSPSPQQQLRGLPQQGSRRLQWHMGGNLIPAALPGQPGGREEYATKRQGPFTKTPQPTECNEPWHHAPSYKQDQAQDARFHMRQALPSNGIFYEADGEALRSLHYPACPVWSTKALPAKGYIMKAYGRHDVFLNQMLRQHPHRKTHPVARKQAPVAIPTSPAEAAAAAPPAWISTSGYERGVPVQILPPTAVVTRGEGITLHPASAGCDSKKLSKAAKGEGECTISARRTTAQGNEGRREMIMVTPSVLQGAEAVYRGGRDALRFVKEKVASEQHTQDVDLFFSALPYGTPGPHAPAYSTNDYDSKYPAQQMSSNPPDNVEPLPQQQRMSSAAKCLTASPQAVTALLQQDGGSPTAASKHALVGLAASVSDNYGGSHPSSVPAAVSGLLPPLQCLFEAQYKPARQAWQCGVLLPPCKNEDSCEDRHGEKPTERLSEPTSTSPTTHVGPASASIELLKLHQRSNVSAQPAHDNDWTGFLLKNNPHIRLSSSSAGSESCSTQCPSPRGTAAAPLCCTAALSTRKASEPPLCIPSSSSGHDLPGSQSTSACPPFMPHREKPSMLSIAATYRQSEHVPQHGFLPVSHYSRAGTSRQPQSHSAHPRQRETAQNSADKTQQQRQHLQSSGRCCGSAERTFTSPLEILAKHAFAPPWLHMYEATRLQVIGVPRGGGATRLLKSAEILLCKTACGAPCATLGARVKEDKNSRQLIFLLPSREVVPVNHLKLLSCISQGSFGTVFQARWEGKTVAVKQAHGSMTLEAMRSVVREINSFRSLDHPLILKYLGVCLDPNFLGIITEYLPGQSIFEALWGSKISFATDKRLKLCRQLVEAVNYMHTEKRLVHRDLKTSNLILNGDDGLKLCDFGKTRLLALHGRLRLEDNGGSPRYMAPECFVVGNLVDEKVDVWGLGCCLMEILGGPIPFEHIHSNEGVIQAVTHKQMSPTVPTWFHPSVKSLLEGCFAFDPEKRPSAQQILDVLQLLSPEEVDRYDAVARRTA